MKKIKLYLLVLLVSQLFVNCTDSDSYDGTSPVAQKRQEFLKEDNYDIVKSKFRKLDVKDKFALWNNKIDQLLAQNFSDEHINLLMKLKAEFKKNSDGKENELKEVFIDLAKITPEKEYIEMFFELDDYTFNGNFDNKVVSNKSLIKYLETCDFTYDNSKLLQRPYLRDCNCNYSCYVQTANPGVCQTDRCNPTSDGCGPFGMSGCDGAVFLC